MKRLSWEIHPPRGSGPGGDPRRRRASGLESSQGHIHYSLCRCPARGPPPGPEPHRMNRRICIFKPISSEFFFETHPARAPMQDEMVLRILPEAVAKPVGKGLE